jgi:DNA-binding NtrC family response regulator
MNHLKIFVVDEKALNHNIFRQYLFALGIENVRAFESGVKCLNNLDEKPDVIFLDYKMEVLSDFEVLKKIKMYNPTSHVILVGAQEYFKAAEDSLKYGALGYMQKGDNDFEKIKSILKTIIEIQELSKKSKLALS